MLTTIEKQFRILWGEWLVIAAMILGGFAVGLILHTIIMRLDSTAESYFSMGTIMAMVMGVMYCFILSITQIRLYFNMEISMGCTRKQFFVSYFVVCLVVDLVYPLALAVLGIGENALNRAWYPNLTNEIDLVPYILKWGIPTAILITIAAGFCGVLLLRFGRPAFWILWAIWMILAIGLPQIHDAMKEAPDSLFGRIGNAVFGAFGGVSRSAVIGAAAILGLACLAGSWFFVRRQQVTS